MDESKVFGRLLQGHRKACDLTQAALARQAACALDTVKKIEAGTRRPSRELVAQFSQGLSLVGDERAAFFCAARAVPAGPDPGLGMRAPVPRPNLPLQLTSFIGREQEIAAIQQRLLDPHVRLLTLTGPGGTGKTRLALQVAAELLDHFPDGVWFVDLAPVSNAAHVVLTIAQTLGLKETAAQPIGDGLRAHLRDRNLLLVLDNFEQVIGAAPLLSDLLHAAAHITMLVTSRMSLH